jgi:uncharacterized membrane protein
MKTRDLALAGLMTAVVFVVTRTLVVPIPQTKGFFNLGEAGVYAAAVLFGPIVGALAGGLGSALADLSLGYAPYAPFTLVIKGLEGALVGLLVRGVSRPVWRVGLAVCAAAALWLLVAADAWLIRAAAGLLLIASAAGLVGATRSLGEMTAARVAGMLTGGLVMVAGYFATQAYALGLGSAAALVEVPWNFVQVVVGLVVGLAAAAATERALPTLSR